MNDNWYKENNFKQESVPLEAACSQEPPQKKRKPLYKRPLFWIGVALVIAVFYGVISKLFFSIADSDRNPFLFEPETEPEYSLDGEMPEDFRDFLDSYYTDTTTTTKSNVYLPEVTERGSMSLKIAFAGEGSVLTLQELYEKCTPSVVYIMARCKGNTSYNWGTGVIVSSDGYIITNTHVIEDCVTADVGLSDGKTYEAKLVGADSVSDLAILKIEADNLTPALFADSGTVNVGDAAIAIGNPLGETYRFTMTNGIISAKDRSVNHNGTMMNLLQTNAAINEGNSGGPLFNDRGQVVGITNMKIINTESGVEGIGFAIPTDTVKSIVSSIMKDGAVMGRAVIGITVGPIPTKAAEYYDIPQGLYISKVQKDSDAAKQGVEAGDILIAVDGQQVYTTQDVSDIKSQLDIGDTMTFTIWRDGEELTIPVKLVDSNEIYN